MSKAEECAKLIERGLHYNNDQDHKKALECFLKAVDTCPDNPECYDELGRSYLFNKQQDKYDECKVKALQLRVDSLQKKVQDDPRDLDSTKNLAKVYFEGRDTDETYFDLAVKYFKKALELDPKNVDTYDCLKGVYWCGKDVDKAIECIQEQIKLNPVADHYGSLGEAYQNIGDNAKAIEAYEKAAELDPQASGTYRELGTIYCELKQYDKAEENLKKLQEVAGKDDWYAVELAQKIKLAAKSKKKSKKQGHVYSFLAEIKWGCAEQPDNPDELPESLKTAKKLWEEAGGRKGADEGKLKEICRLTAEALRCVFIPGNLTSGSEDIAMDDEVEGTDIKVHGADFTDGDVPTVKASAVFKIKFKRSFSSAEELKAWEEENDRLDNCLSFQFDGVDGEYCGMLSTHEGLSFTLIE